LIYALKKLLDTNYNVRKSLYYLLKSTKKKFKYNNFFMLIKIPNFFKKFIIPTSNLAYFFKKILNLNIYHFHSQGDLNFKCSFCKNSKLISYLSNCKPDFDIRFIKKKLLKKFYLRSVGKCLNCGLMQDYNRPSLDDLNTLKKLYPSKDDMVSEEIWSSYPVPKKEILRIYKLYYHDKFIKWDQKLIFDHIPKKILFLRPTLGFDIEYFKKRYKKLDVYFADISKISERTILLKYPDIKKININIHSVYSGNLKKYNNYFDLIISNHNLVHVYDLDDTITKIKNLINLKGKVVFSQEISIKPWNPFHYNFYDELMFVKILKKYFYNIERIKDVKNRYPKYSSNVCFLVSNNL